MVSNKGQRKSGGTEGIQKGGRAKKRARGISRRKGRGSEGHGCNLERGVPFREEE